MARSTVKPAAFHSGARGVLGADRVVRAKRGDTQPLGQVGLQMAGLLDKTAESPSASGLAV